MNVKMDDCFQFGLGAFETISVVDGRPIFLDRHLRRLEDAARFLNLGMPAERGIDRIAVLEYLRKWMSEHAMVRIWSAITRMAISFWLS